MITTTSIALAAGQTRIIKILSPVVVVGRDCQPDEIVECPAYDAAVIVGLGRAEYVVETESAPQGDPPADDTTPPAGDAKTSKSK